MKGTSIWIALAALAVGRGIQEVRVSTLYAQYESVAGRLLDAQRELANTAANVDSLATSTKSLADSMVTTIHTVDTLAGSQSQVADALDSHSRAIINLSGMRLGAGSK